MRGLLFSSWLYCWLGLPWMGCLLTILGNPNPLYSRRILTWTMVCFMVLSLGFLMYDLSVQDFLTMDHSVKNMISLPAGKIGKSISTGGLFPDVMASIWNQGIVWGGIFLAVGIFLASWSSRQTAIGLGALGCLLLMMMGFFKQDGWLLFEPFVLLLLICRPLFQISTTKCNSKIEESEPQRIGPTQTNRQDIPKKRMSWLNRMRLTSLTCLVLVAAFFPQQYILEVSQVHIGRTSLSMVLLLLSMGLFLPWPTRKDIQAFEKTTLLGKFLWGLCYLLLVSSSIYIWNRYFSSINIMNMDFNMLFSKHDSAFWITFFSLFSLLSLIYFTRSYGMKNILWTIPFFALHPGIGIIDITKELFFLKIMMSWMVFVWVAYSGLPALPLIDGPTEPSESCSNKGPTEISLDWVPMRANQTMLWYAWISPLLSNFQNKKVLSPDASPEELSFWNLSTRLNSAMQQMVLTGMIFLWDLKIHNMVNNDTVFFIPVGILLLMLHSYALCQNHRVPYRSLVILSMGCLWIICYGLALAPLDGISKIGSIIGYGILWGIILRPVILAQRYASILHPHDEDIAQSQFLSRGWVWTLVASSLMWCILRLSVLWA